VRARALAAGRILQANLVRPSRPVKINLALTYWCQYRCQTCNIWKRQPSDELTTRELLQFIQLNRRVSWLDLTGGEIFLRDDIDIIFDAVVETWRELAVLHFPTNGFLTDKIVGVAERIGRRGIPDVVVTVSLDGDEALNDRIRGIKGGFRRQVQTFNALRQVAGVRPVFGMTLSQHNVGEFERTFEACQRECPGLEIGDFHLNVAQVSEHYYGNAGDGNVVPSRDAAVHELQIYRARRGIDMTVAAWVETRYLGELETFLHSGITPMPCHALRSSCFIDPWGIVFPCITYTRPIGRLRDTGMRLEPIWNDAGTRAVQREIWNGQCPQCWTACEAYQSILGNLLRPGRRRAIVTPAPDTVNVMGQLPTQGSTTGRG
jgi:radical SAM protein with 4Fe4S-binding SPASM domain